jgi:hypothetical protein
MRAFAISPTPTVAVTVVFVALAAIGSFRSRSALRARRAGDPGCSRSPARRGAASSSSSPADRCARRCSRPARRSARPPRSARATRSAWRELRARRARARARCASAGRSARPCGLTHERGRRGRWPSSERVHALDAHAAAREPADAREQVGLHATELARSAFVNVRPATECDCPMLSTPLIAARTSASCCCAVIELSGHGLRKRKTAPANSRGSRWVPRSSGGPSSASLRRPSITFHTRSARPFRYSVTSRSTVS